MLANTRPNSDGISPSRSASRDEVVVRNVVGGVIGAALWISFAVVHVMVFRASGRVVGVGLAATELITAILFLARRQPIASTGRVRDWATGLVGSFGSLLARPGGLHSATGDVVGLSLQAIGLAVVVLGLLALGRSFGIVAANRGVVTSGPYRLVRHPLYVAYVVEQAGYLVQSVRWWNAVVFAVVWACQVARIRAEERVLSSDPEYGRYRQTTRYRLVPGVW
jgi:protein-S-isoprenylcysteine O-methyltransferase Ste14